MDEKDQVSIVLPAGGSGSRFGKTPKQYQELNGKAMLLHTLEALLALGPKLKSIVIAAPAKEEEKVRLLCAHLTVPITVVTGGDTRQESVYNGLYELYRQHLKQATLNPEKKAFFRQDLQDSESSLCSFAPQMELGTKEKSESKHHCELSTAGFWWVHDAARPLVSKKELDQLWLVMQEHQCAALLALPSGDTLKESEDHTYVSRTLDRSRIWQAQTPQGAPATILWQAVNKAKEEKFIGTDEASLLEYAGFAVRLVEASFTNLKVTRAEDWDLFKALAHLKS